MPLVTVRNPKGRIPLPMAYDLVWLRRLPEAWSCWFKTSTQQTNRYLLAMAKNLSGNNGLDLCFQGGDVASYIVGSSSFIYLNHPTNYYDNQWHMLTVTYNGTNAVLYYDVLRLIQDHLHN